MFIDCVTTSCVLSQKPAVIHILIVFAYYAEVFWLGAPFRGSLNERHEWTFRMVNDVFSFHRRYNTVNYMVRYIQTHHSNWCHVLCWHCELLLKCRGVGTPYCYVGVGWSQYWKLGWVLRSLEYCYCYRHSKHLGVSVVTQIIWDNYCYFTFRASNAAFRFLCHIPGCS